MWFTVISGFPPAKRQSLRCRNPNEKSSLQVLDHMYQAMASMSSNVLPAFASASSMTCVICSTDGGWQSLAQPHQTHMTFNLRGYNIERMVFLFESRLHLSHHNYFQLLESMFLSILSLLSLFISKRYSIASSTGHCNNHFSCGRLRTPEFHINIECACCFTHF